MVWNPAQEDAIMRSLLALLILAAAFAVGACSNNGSSTSPSVNPVDNPPVSSPVTSPEASPSA